MKENITSIESFHCPICDYGTSNPSTLELIRRTDTCPACQNGKPASYSCTNKERIHNKKLRELK